MDQYSLFPMILELLLLTRPAAALGVRVRVGLHAVCLTLVRADACDARPRLHEACERLSVECSIGSGMHWVVQCEANAQGTNRRAVATNRLGARTVAQGESILISVAPW